MGHAHFVVGYHHYWLATGDYGAGNLAFVVLGFSKLSGVCNDQIRDQVFSVVSCCCSVFKILNVSEISAEMCVRKGNRKPVN